MSGGSRARGPTASANGASCCYGWTTPRTRRLGPRSRPSEPSANRGPGGDEQRGDQCDDCMGGATGWVLPELPVPSRAYDFCSKLGMRGARKGPDCRMHPTQLLLRLHARATTKPSSRGSACCVGRVAAAMANLAKLLAYPASGDASGTADAQLGRARKWARLQGWQT